MPAIYVPEVSDITNTLAEMRLIAEAGIRYRDAKGFTKTTWESLPARLLSLDVEVGEVVEALEAHRCESTIRHTWALRYELADCAMYATEILEDLWPGAWTFRNRYHGAKRLSSPALMLVSPMRRHFHDAVRAWAKDNERDCQISIELLLSALCDLRGKLVRGPLLDDVKSKIRLMADRPARHGKRRGC